MPVSTRRICRIHNEEGHIDNNLPVWPSKLTAPLDQSSCFYLFFPFFFVRSLIFICLLGFEMHNFYHFLFHIFQVFLLINVKTNALHFLVVRTSCLLFLYEQLLVDNVTITPLSEYVNSNFKLSQNFYFRNNIFNYFSC